MASNHRLLPSSFGPPSPRGMLSPPLLALLYYLAHVRGGPYLEDVAVLQGRMLRHELCGVVQIASFKDENATELHLGFCIGTVRSRDFAVLPVQSQGGLRRLKGFSTSPVTAGAKMVVIFKSCVEHGVSLAVSHAIEFAFVVVAKTEIFHCSFPPFAEFGLPSFVPSDHRCTGITNCVRCSRGSAIAMTGEPGRLAPQIAGSM